MEIYNALTKIEGIGVIMAILVGVFWAASNMLSRKGIGNISAKEGVLLNFICNVFFLLPFAFWILLKNPEGWNNYALMAFAVSGIFLTFTGMLALLRSMVLIGANKATQLRLSEPIFGVIIGLGLFKESLVLWQSIGIGMILVIVIIIIVHTAIMSGRLSLLSKRKINLGWFLGILSGFGFAISTVLRKVGLAYFPEPIVCAFFVYFFATCFLLIVIWRDKGLKSIVKRYRDNWKDARYFVFGGLAETAASLLISWSVLRTDVAIVTSLAPAGVPVFTLVFSLILLGSREVISPFIVVTGIVLSVGMLTVVMGSIL